MIWKKTYFEICLHIYTYIYIFILARLSDKVFRYSVILFTGSESLTDFSKIYRICRIGDYVIGIAIISCI